MPDQTSNRRSRIRNNQTNLSPELINLRQELISYVQRQENMRNRVKEHRTKMRTIIEHGGIIWISPEIPYTYVIVKSTPIVAIARVYGQTTKVVNGQVSTFLRCDLFSRKPVRLNNIIAGTNPRFTFVCDYKDFPVNKDSVLQYLPDPDFIIRDDNNVIQELQFTNDPLKQYIDSGIY